MPTTYTHDLFGKRIYQKMPVEIRELIRENEALYRIGLHGPDILFYYMISKNPVSQFGVRMHDEQANYFFERGMYVARKTGNRALKAYLLGFGCHYLLDSYCHPFVNEMAEKEIISHTLLEKEFDRYLMSKTGKDPLKYRPSDCIKARFSFAAVIREAIPEIKISNIYVSLKMMKFLTNLMVCNDGGRRRKLIGKILSRSKKKETVELLEHFMTLTPSANSRKPVEQLNQLFEEAVEEAPEFIKELYQLTVQDRALSDRWKRTYNG